MYQNSSRRKPPPLPSSPPPEPPLELQSPTEQWGNLAVRLRQFLAANPEFSKSAMEIASSAIGRAGNTKSLMQSQPNLQPDSARRFSSLDSVKRQTEWMQNNLDNIDRQIADAKRLHDAQQASRNAELSLSTRRSQQARNAEVHQLLEQTERDLRGILAQQGEDDKLDKTMKIYVPSLLKVLEAYAGAEVPPNVWDRAQKLFSQQILPAMKEYVSEEEKMDAEGVGTVPTDITRQVKTALAELEPAMLRRNTKASLAAARDLDQGLKKLVDFMLNMADLE